MTSKWLNVFTDYSTESVPQKLLNMDLHKPLDIGNRVSTI